MNNNYIAVLDSGFGGLSVLKHLISFLPNEKFIFYADSKNAPYGTRSTADILNLTTNDISVLLEYNPKVIVIACNTISVNCYLSLANVFPNTHFQFIFPTITTIFNTASVVSNTTAVFDFKNEIFNKSTNKLNVLLLSTSATAKSDFVKNEFKQFSNIINFNIIPADPIVRFVENMDFDSASLDSYLSNLFSSYHNIDYIILGCTHFPFVMNSIKKYVSKNTIFIDNGYNEALNTKIFLEKNDLLSNNSTFELNIIDTKNDTHRHNTFSKLLNIPINKMSFIN